MPRRGRIRKLRLAVLLLVLLALAGSSFSYGLVVAIRSELAARRPRSQGELAAVKGLGPTKVERYGDELLALLATA